MMTIYLDSDSKCHVTDNGTMTPFETAHFDGKCKEFIEGHICKPEGGMSGGTMVAPWKDYDELDRVQREYERQLIVDYESALAEIEAALGV